MMIRVVAQPAAVDPLLIAGEAEDMGAILGPIRVGDPAVQVTVVDDEVADQRIGSPDS